MRTFLISAITGATLTLAGAANAAVLDFDLSGLNGVFGSSVTGGFSFDTDTMAVSNVAFATGDRGPFSSAAPSSFSSGMSIGTGSFSSSTTAAFLFEGSATDFLLEVRGGFSPSTPGIDTGASQMFAAFGNEGAIDSNFFIQGAPADIFQGTVNVTNATPTAAIPLPAGMPLLLAGLGLLGLVRKRRAA